jgi:endoglucanase
MTSRNTLDADFHGGVMREYVQGAKVRFFPDDETEITGVVNATKPSRERPGFPQSVKVRVRRPVAKGALGMFDQGVARTKGAKFICRVCDDLAGVAAALAMLDALHRRRPLETTISVLLTRAEEVGFIGALAAIRDESLLRRRDRIISIECSWEQPFAKQGSGVIIRVGDRTSVFNSSLTHFLTQQAVALAKSDKTFKFQRQLMSGGSCEGTAFDVYGYTTAAACVALGNYHNMDRTRKRIAPEYIDLNDWRNMVKLFVRLSESAHQYDPQMRFMKARLERRFRALSTHLQR